MNKYLAGQESVKTKTQCDHTYRQIHGQMNDWNNKPVFSHQR